VACVYLLRFPNGRGYVGRTRLTAEDRFRRHIRAARRGSDFLVHRAIRKYGYKEVQVKVLVAGLEWVESAKVEREQIAKSATMVPGGYNLSGGGEGINDPTGKIGRKISKALQGRPLSLSTRKKLAESHRGRKLTMEHRSRISAGHRTKSSRRKIAESNRRRTVSQKTRQKMAASHRGRQFSKEHRANMCKAQALRRLREKTCQPKSR
jgi:hypothetical protein